MYANKEMSLEENKQEEGPGAFLSLSAQVSSSPFRGSPAVEISPRVFIKQEEGDLETCLSLQQPNQLQPVESLHEQQAIVHAQEPLRTHVLDQTEAPCIASPLYEPKAGDSSQQTRLSLSEEILERQSYIGAAGEIQKSSSLDYEHPSSLHSSASSCVQRPPEQQSRTATWLTLAEQQRVPTSLGLSQQQKSLEHPKETSSRSSLASFHDISGQKKPSEFSLPVSPLSLQLSPKQEKHVGSAEDEKLSASTESEKMPHLKFSSEQISSFLQRPGMLSPQPEQEKDLSVVAQEQPALSFSKELMDQHTSTHLHSHPDQQKLSLPQQWRKSAFTQASAVQSSLDPPKDASRQGPYSEQKFNFIQGYSSPQKAVPERKAESPVISHSQLHCPQQIFMLQSPPTMLDRAGVVFSKPNIVVTPNALVRDKEPNLSRESALAYVTSPQSSEHVHPAPLATQEAVLADKRLFFESLQSFHAALNSQVSVPKIEGTDLDLYKLYKEVTSRGGLEAVLKRGAWQEVVHAFNFPSNALHVSNLLKKTYIHTFGHYEQVYFLGTGRSILRAAYTSQSPTLSEQDGRGSWDMESGLRSVNGSIDSAQARGDDPTSSVGAIVSGAIDGKFEDGYLVTVMVGGRRLKGVLYHVPSADTPPQNALVPSMVQSINSEMQSAEVVAKVGRKRKSREAFRKDPNAPRQNRTGYNFFFAEQRAKLKTMQPDKDRAISKMIGELWSKLTEDERSPYQVKGVQDKERYVKEMKEYKEKLKVPFTGGSIDVTASPPLPSQLQYTHMPQPSNDPNAVPLQLTSSYVPQWLQSSKSVLPQHSMAITLEAVKDSKVALQEQPLALVEVTNVSQTAPLAADNTTMRMAEQPNESTSSSYTIAASGHTTVNVVSSTAIIQTPTPFSTSDPLVTSTVHMSKFLVDEASPKMLPQPGSEVGPDGPIEMEKQASAMEH